MIPVSFPYSHDVLRKLLPFISSDETRYVLNGVLVECDPGENVRLVATDARRMIVHQPEWKHSIQPGMKPARFIIPKCMIDCVEGGDWRNDTDEITVDGFGVVRMTLGNLTIQAKSIEGHYPEWQIVVPKVMPTAFPDRRFIGNAVFIRDMLDAVESLASPISGNAAQFVSEKGDMSPIICKYDHGFVIMMPMRDKDSE